MNDMIETLKFPPIVTVAIENGACQINAKFLGGKSEGVSFNCPYGRPSLEDYGSAISILIANILGACATSSEE